MAECTEKLVKSYTITLNESEFLWLYKILNKPIANCHPDSELIEDKEYRRAIFHPIKLTALDKFERENGE